MSWRVLERSAVTLAITLLATAALAERLQLTLVARAGVGDGYLATDVPLARIEDIAVDAGGRLYLADAAWGRIRRIGLDGVITTVVGEGRRRTADEGGPAIDVLLSNPTAIAIAADGTIYFAENYSTIRSLTPDGSLHTVIAQDAVDPPLGIVSDLAVDTEGNLYAAEPYLNRVLKRAVDGSISVFGEVGRPTRLAINRQGHLVVAGGLFAEVIELSSDGSSAMTLWQRTRPDGLAFSPDDVLLLTANGRVFRADVVLTPIVGRISGGYSGDGGSALDAELSRPDQIASGQGGDLFILDSGNFVIRHVNAQGIISTIAGNGSRGRFGDGGPAEGAMFTCRDIAQDVHGNLFVADYLNRRVARIAPDGTIDTYVQPCGATELLASGVTVDACLASPAGIDIASDGTLYIADLGDQVVRRVTTDGAITVIAGNGVDDDFSAGVPATETSLTQPYDVAVATDGSIYVSQQESPRIAHVSRNGTISTALGNGGFGVPVDGERASDAPLDESAKLSSTPDGRLLVTSGGGYGAVYEIRTDGTIWRIAGGVAGFSGDGGPAREARLSSIDAAVVLPSGELFISEVSNRRVRRVRDGVIETVAGTGLETITPASVGSPSGMVVGRDGTIFICDGANSRILRLDPAVGAATCPGDCNDDGRVVVSELVRTVDVMLREQVNDCESFGGTRERLTIANLIEAVGSALHGCEVRTVAATTGD